VNTKNSCRSVCLCDRGCEGAGVRLLTQQLRLCDLGRRTVMFVETRAEGSMFMQNDGTVWM
jgi:hypothetical protein